MLAITRGHLSAGQVPEQDLPPEAAVSQPTRQCGVPRCGLPTPQALWSEECHTVQ